MFKSDLEEVIKKWPAADVIPSPVWHGAFRVERPTSMEFGDFATNAALVAAPYLKKNPKDLAVDLKSYL